MKNAEYWEQRSLALSDSLFEDTLSFEKEVMKVYEENAKEIEKEISHFITKYAKENGLTYAEASKNLTKVELGDCRKQINKLLKQFEKTGSPELLKRMEELKTRAILTRLDSLKAQLDARVYAMTETIVNDTREHLEEIYEKAYYGYGDDVMVGLELDEALHSINFKVPPLLTSYPYSGLMFSERIWKCTDKVSLSVKETLQRGLIQGKSIRNMMKDLDESLKQKGVSGYRNYDLERVIRTETFFIEEQAHADVNKKYGVKRFMIVCALDERTCRKCAPKHETVELEEERRMGDNAPPFHPNCRCVTVPWGDFKYGDVIGEEIEYDLYE